MGVMLCWQHHHHVCSSATLLARGADGLAQLERGEQRIAVRPQRRAQQQLLTDDRAASVASSIFFPPLSSEERELEDVGRGLHAHGRPLLRVRRDAQLARQPARREAHRARGARGAGRSFRFQHVVVELRSWASQWGHTVRWLLLPALSGLQQVLTGHADVASETVSRTDGAGCSHPRRVAGPGDTQKTAAEAAAAAWPDFLSRSAANLATAMIASGPVGLTDSDLARSNSMKRRNSKARRRQQWQP